MTSSNWTREPLIEWSQYYCKYCSQPCDGCTNCEQFAKPDTKEGHMHNGLFMPIKAVSCLSRNTIAFIVTVNFPVSNSLLKTLNRVAGMNVVKPVGPHEMYVEINKLFDRQEVQKAFNIEYVAFIKSQQANLPLVQEILSKQSEQVVTLPNGKSTLVDAEIKEILENEFRTND
jgi:hypothetical protein